ncbi:hypothetical protein ACOD3F_003879, partial [Acinetobacter baumannii]
NSPTSKDFFKMNFKELLNNYWLAILVSIVFLIFAFNQNFFIDEVTYTLKLASIALAGLTFATFMIKINKIEDLSRKLTDDGVLTLINILSVYPEYVENVKAKLRKSNKLIVHDILIIRWDFNNQISEILKMGNFTSDKNKTDEISISSIEDLRTTKNKLSLLLVDLDISIKAQEAFTWKQSIQK